MEIIKKGGFGHISSESPKKESNIMPMRDSNNTQHEETVNPHKDTEVMIEGIDALMENIGDPIREVCEQLVKSALEARHKAYVPYSGYAVGAALLARNGKVYTGCNIENAAFSPTVCAERTAFFKAVSEGVRFFNAIAIVGGPDDSEPTDFAPPCGVCRQVMAEFCDPESFLIILGNCNLEWKIYKLKELLPDGFYPDKLSYL